MKFESRKSGTINISNIDDLKSWCEKNGHKLKKSDDNPNEFQMILHVGKENEFTTVPRPWWCFLTDHTYYGLYTKKELNQNAT